MPPHLRHSPSAPKAPADTPPRANAPADNFSAEFAHACALRDVDDLAGAADAFGRLCLRYPERAETFKALGYVLYQRGMHDRAPAPLLFGFLLDANDPTPLYFAALSERHLGEHEIAREIATDALQVAQASHAHARLAQAAQRLIATL